MICQERSLENHFQTDSNRILERCRYECRSDVSDKFLKSNPYTIYNHCRGKIKKTF